MTYEIGQVFPRESKILAEMDALLQREGIRVDKQLDYRCAMFDENGAVIATGSCFGNTLRCLAVSRDHQGEQLINQIVTHLINVELARGNAHLFLYTKCCSAKFFADLGFREIVRVRDQIVFMENQRDGFTRYLAKLGAAKIPCVLPSKPKIAAMVMNANPFTRGHQFLVEKAARENDLVHLFVLSDESSLFPPDVRKSLVAQGVAHLPNVILHDTENYLISQATFPSYFQRDDDAVIESQIQLDLRLFAQIAAALGITRRYVGDEPFSHVTRLYNQAMAKLLPEFGVQCEIVPRCEINGAAISASNVRQAIRQNDWQTIEKSVPPTTLAFLQSDKAKPIIEKIRAAENVVHY